MKKEMIRGGVFLAVAMIAYHLIAFLAPFMKSATFWVSYLFTLMAFVMASGAMYIAFFRKPDARSRFYGFPIVKVGMIHCSGQLIVGLVVMSLAAWVPVWMAAIIYIVAFAVAAAGIISS